MDEKARLQHFSDRVSYCPTSGKIYWSEREVVRKGDKVFNTKYAGKVAGGLRPDGYIGIVSTIDGRHESVLAHRLAWFIVTGECPEAIDHIDHDRSNNALENLRAADRDINSKNQSIRSDNKTGVTGVYWSPQHRKYRATAQTKTGRIHIGLYDTVEAAAVARAEASARLGFHENHGTLR